ncbi:hypothetical protein Patl1_37410 [Pistacia atlantica]|nr:hypothetical protein Patl1_37410 [Pistacia atlantica]
MEHRQLGGNKFMVCHSRNQPHDSISQKLYLQKDMHYTFSAWFQVSEGEVPVTAYIKTSSSYKFFGAVVAESKCWSMLKGGFTADESTPAELAITHQLKYGLIVSHYNHSPKKSGTPIKIKALRRSHVSSRRPIGCATNKNILNNKKYQNWFTARFGLTTFENEMKWYSTEPSQGKKDYSVADAMLQFMKQNRIAVRGHNIFWDDPKYQPGWLNSLSPLALRLAVEKRAKSIVTRYKGQLIARDVINENLHFSFFENKMGADASKMAFKYANQYDPSTLMFMNDYNTIEEKGDQVSSPANYLKKLREIQSSLSKGAREAIGLESHFRVPNIPYMRASIDKLAAAGVPIWLTEVDVEKGPSQALFLEQVLREGHSHPKVGGIVIWGAWSPQGCYRMCLTDNNFNNLPTGNVVDKLLNEWGRRKLQATTDDNGFFEVSLSHGDYEVKVNHPTIKSSSLVHTLTIVPSRNSSTVLLRDSP